MEDAVKFLGLIGLCFVIYVFASSCSSQLNSDAERSTTGSASTSSSRAYDYEEDDAYTQEMHRDMEVMDYEAQVSSWQSDQENFAQWNASGEQREEYINALWDWTNEIINYPKSKVPSGYESVHSTWVQMARDLQRQLS